MSTTSCDPMPSIVLGPKLPPGSCMHEGSLPLRAYDVLEEDLIIAAQRGDQRAFVELCDRYSAPTKRKIFSIVRNQEDAEDALQDTLMRAYKHISSFRGSCRFSTWLTTIGTNSALMVLRQRKARREANPTVSDLDGEAVEQHDPADKSLGPEDINLRQQTVLILKREIQKLHPNLRSIIKHYYESECTLEEAAKAEEISLAGAKSRLMRGRMRLRSSLLRHGISEP